MYARLSAERLSFDSDTFDLLLGCNPCHHLDLGRALEANQKGLEERWKGSFLPEPLGHNPFLKPLTDNMTPHLRSRDEMPLPV